MENITETNKSFVPRIFLGVVALQTYIRKIIRCMKSPFSQVLSHIETFIYLFFSLILCCRCSYTGPVAVLHLELLLMLLHQISCYLQLHHCLINNVPPNAYCFCLFLPARASEQGNVIGSVRIYIYIYIIYIYVYKKNCN